MHVLPPLADEGLHTALIKQRLPAWVIHTAPVDLRRLRHGLLPGRDRSTTKVPLSPALSKVLDDCRKASRQSREALARSLAALQGITEFAQPKLEAALREALGEAPDVNKNQLHYLRYRQAPQQHSLLQAALLNFDGDEDFTDIALEQTSALAPEGALLTEYYGETRADGSRAARYRYSETLSMTPSTFSSLCRTLDLGRQYQAHLAQVFEAPATRAVVREQMIRAQKDLLTVRLYEAWTQSEIGSAVFLMLRQLLAGTSRPLLDGQAVRVGQLSILGCELGEVLLIGPGVAPLQSVLPPLFPGAGVSGLQPVAPDTRVVAWIPGAPQSPLKEYPSMHAFDKALAVNLRSPAYQQLFAGLVPQQQAPQFLERLKEKLYTSIWNPRGYKEQVYDEQLNLNRRERVIEGEVFGALYDRHLQRLKDNARTLAVPTAEADRKAAQARHAHWLSMGLNTLNVAAFMVPGLGEVLLAVTAIQLCLDVYHGIEAWQQGDMDAAWEHLESVALNLGFMATLGGVAAIAGRRPPIGTSTWVDGLVPVKLPNGERRLWKPDLAAYRSNAVLDTSLKPNAQGQYTHDGKLYVRLGEGLYEQAFDTRIRKWRIRHPDNPGAYQPILEHNRAGAWRHTHERPLEWDRLTLLRRLGHETQGVSDTTLSAIGDISGISDERLRKVHLDGLPLPAVLADTLQLFRGASTPQVAVPSPEGAILQRRFPSLSAGAISEMLSTASEKERLQILGRSGASPRLDNLARRAVQQRRLSRALAGLYLPALASLDSDRLALHCLQQLPGWSPGLRLELRVDSFGGRLLAEAGPEDAAVRRYLVKQGETFLACDLQGAPLNSPVPGNRNFYPSLFQALPEATRQALGLPLLGADVELQQALARYATAHRVDMAAVLKIRTPRARPPLRLASGSLGYALSGRATAQASNTALTARVRDVYPNLSDDAARLFVQRLSQAGQRPPQIYALIGNRERELTQLRMTLDDWVTRSTGQAGAQHAADRLIDCWREGAQLGPTPHAYLSLGRVADLPALNADFSHVRGLGVSGETLAGEQGVRLAQQFSSVEVLNVFTEPAHVDAMADGLGHFPRLEELSIDGWGLTYLPAFLQRLNTLSQLRRLALRGALETLDVSDLKQLLVLRVAGPLKEWPEGVLALDNLQTLDLWATGIATVPAAMLEGHERLWRGLSLNWGVFERQAFMPVYQHVKGHTGHLVDEVLMVDAYCEGALRRLKDSDPLFAPNALAFLRRHRLTSDAKLTRVHALLDEQATLQQVLQEWQGRELEIDRRPVDPLNRQRAADRLMAYWRDGLDRRFVASREAAGPSSPVASEGFMLDLSGAVLGDLPLLPAAGFTHVQRLNLAGTRASVASLNDFLPQFTQIHGLDLSRCNLLDLPASLTQLRALRQLDLAHNQLTITEAIQQRLSALVTLRGLNLDYNRVGTLDVSALNQLRSLSLSHTATTAWPTGWLALPELLQVDLSYSAITTIPLAALTGHDRLMLSSSVRGCRLTLPACADIQRFALRTYQDNPLNIAPQTLPRFGPGVYLNMPLGIPSEGLAEGRTGGDPEYFPQEVTDSPDLLLALPIDVPASELSMPPAQRLQQIDPALSTRDAVRCIDELLASGLGALEVEARLVRWRTDYQGMVRALNDWIDIRGYRQGGGWISAVDRRRAADRLIDSWRYTLRARPEVTPSDGRGVLQLSDLYLGDLPALPAPLAHVSELNLNAVKLTEQGSNAFLRAFPNLRTLTLNNNGLVSLPDAVGEYAALTELQASHNELRYSSALQRQLNRLAALQRLDLSENVLDSLDISSLPHLQSLELRGNNLLAWPQGVLQAAQLRNLDLRSNRIETIPEDALLPRHSVLMWGTDLSDNLLIEEDVARLREYEQQTGCGLGFTAEELEDPLDASRSTDSSSVSDIHPELLTPEQQKAQWFSGIAADSTRHRVWSVLKQAENSEDFFYLISQLKNAQDFVHDRADLTRRVWAVLEAAEQYPTLREQVFSQAQAMRVRATCGDGWILLFSDLEISVYEFEALRTPAPAQLGSTLFNLARRMIRLDEAERIAGEAIKRSPNIDPAEIRLAYRIGLAERLDLPHQPSTMLYRNLSRVNQADIDQAYTAILARENTPVFMQELIKRPYWVGCLQKLYPEEFSVLAQSHKVKVDALEELHPEINAVYLGEVAALDTQNLAEQQALALRLSARARRDLGI